MTVKYRLKARYESVEDSLAGDLKKTFSVTELTQSIRTLLEGNLSSVAVEGEISNFKRHSSGHLYFSVKDENAQLSCVMFRRENFTLGFEPADGMKVVCFGRVSVYEPRGQYQLYVERLEPKGIGALQVRFEALKEKMRLEGLFDAGAKKEIPFLPRRVALVTSADGAALRDILNVLGRRHGNAHILIYPVPVQGGQAAPAIAEAVDTLNNELAADVMILARGGGSLEDLWAFNEEIVARSIFRSAIPVISAIGHETDFTIADFVADLRAPTPSAAAELVLPRHDELCARLAEMRARTGQAMDGFLRRLRDEWKALAESRPLKDPLAAFETLFQRLDESEKALGLAFKHLVLSKREGAAALLGKLDALGPLATLRRGFSVTLKHPEMKVVSSVRSVARGDEVRTRLKDGSFISRITEVEHGG